MRFLIEVSRLCAIIDMQNYARRHLFTLLKPGEQCHLCRNVINCTRETFPVSFYSSGNVKHRNGQKLYYDILDVPHDATQAQIKSAYYKLSKVYHPDVNRSAEARAKFHEMSEAYEILGSAYSRRLYDKGLVKPMARPSYYKPGPVAEEAPLDPLRRPPQRNVGFNFDKWYYHHYQKHMKRHAARQHIEELENMEKEFGIPIAEEEEE